MRFTRFFLTALALSALPAAALAHNNAEGAIEYDQYDNASGATCNVCTVPAQRVSMESNSASLPITGYAVGDAYIVNPLDVTNTRDNRGDIPATTAAPDYRIYRPVQNAS